MEEQLTETDKIRINNSIPNRYWFNYLRDALKSHQDIFETGPSTDLQEIVLSIDAQTKDSIHQLVNQSPVGRFVYLTTCLKVTLHYCFEIDHSIFRVSPAKQSQSTHGKSPIFISQPIAGKALIKDLLSEVRSSVLKGLENKDYDFDHVVNVLQTNGLPANDILNQITLFDSSLHEEESDLGNNILKIRISEQDELLRITLESDCINELTLSGIADSYAKSISMLVKNLNLHIEDIDFYPLEELPDFDSVEQMMILNRFEETARAFPDKIALVFGNECLSYGYLNSRANQLANFIVDRTKDDSGIVALLIDRSLMTLISILGVMKSGSAYLPIDPDQPLDRISYFIRDSDAKIILGYRSDYGKLNDPKLYKIDEIDLDDYPSENLNKAIKPGDLMYTMYTSGSTGLPKAVAINNSSVYNLVNSIYEKVGCDTTDQLLSIATYSFDISVLEYFLALNYGATLLLMDKNLLAFSHSLRTYLLNSKPTIIQTTPSIWKLILESEWNAENEVKCLSGGEAITPGIGNGILEKYKELWIVYGPTETTIWSSIIHVQNPSLLDTIGYPVDKTELLLLNKHGKKLPVGIASEILIGGQGLARGYLNRPELTNQRFMVHPQNANRKLYKTGDLGKYTKDNNIAFLGRTDFQIKLRGIRIELGEIENAISSLNDIDEAVIFLDPRREQLVAAVRSNKSFEDKFLRKSLLDKLPGYMIPSRYYSFDVFPLNKNGKVDRGELFKEIQNKSLKVGDSVKPVDQVEEEVLKIWKEVLGITTGNTTDNFFFLGGNSLLAIQLLEQIKDHFNKEITLAELAEDFCVSKIAKIVSEKDLVNKKTKFPQIISDQENLYEPFPLSPIQQAYWVGRSSAFELGNVSTLLYKEIEIESLDLVKFNRSIEILQKRHPMLTITIDENGFQRFNKVTSYNVEVVDLRPLPEEEIEAKLFEIRDRLRYHLGERNQDFFGVLISQLPNTYRIHFSLDLIIADGYSIRLLEKEFSQLYFENETLDEQLDITFRDYILAEQGFQNGDLYLQAKKYWINRLDNFPAGPPIPLARQISSINQPRFKNFTHSLSYEEWSRLKKKCSDLSITPTTLLLTVFSKVLSKWSNADHFTINMTVFNRLPFHKDINKIVGDFTSINLTEIKIDQGMDLVSLAKEIHKQLLMDFQHRYYSGIELIRELIKRNSGSSNAMMPVVFTSALALDEESTQGQVKSSDEDLEQIFGSSQTSQVWLDYQVSEVDGELGILWTVVDQLFPDQLIEDMFDCYRTLLINLSETEDTWNIQKLDLLPVRQNEIISQSNQVEETPVLLPIFHLFEAEVKKSPDSIAIEHNDFFLSYQALDHLSNNLADKLIKEGVRKGEFVGIHLAKGWEQIVSSLAIVKCGAAYVPFDVEWPETRVNQLIANTSMKVIITNHPGKDFQIKKVAVNKKLEINSSISPSIQIDPTDLAYVIFTSGSTGTPKGVMMAHGPVSNTLQDINHRFQITKMDKAIGVSNLTFDLSVYDIFGILGSGGTLVIPDRSETPDPESWRKLILQKDINIWNSAPPLIELLLHSADEIEINPFRLVMLSGDWISVSLPSRLWSLNKRVKIISLGGATEASIWSIYFPIESVNPDWTSIPYGKALKNQEMWVLDNELNPCPIWVKGDIYIGGIGLSDGYYGDEEKTRNSFVRHPRTKKGLYKTGDLGRVTLDGNIEFLGREDNQIKINGIRVEIGEIQAAILKYPGVEKAIVVFDTQSNTKEKILVGYIQGLDRNDPSIKESIDQHLREILPDYMIPKYYAILDSFPLSSNGKIDRKALPKIDDISQEKNQENSGKLSPLHKKIQQLWSEVLGVPQITLHSNFFELGGHSLLAIQILSRIHRELNFRLDLRSFFNNPTVEACARMIEEKMPERFKQIPLVEEQDYYNLSESQKRFWLLEQLNDNNDVHFIFSGFEITGKLDIKRLQSCFQQLLSRHEILRTGIIQVGDIPVQKIFDHVEIQLDYEDLSMVSDPINTCSKRITRDTSTKFGFQKGEVFKCKLFKLSDDVHYLYYILHHIAGDAESIEIINSELSNFYYSEEVKPEALKIQYKDFSSWQNTFNHNQNLAEHRLFWEHMHQKPIVLDLPTTFPRGPIRTTNGKVKHYQLQSENFNKIKKLCEQNDSTFFMGLLASIYILLAKYTGQSRIVIGTPVTGRNHVDLEGQIGLYLNTLALAQDVNKEATFLEILYTTKSLILKGMEHSAYPFDALVGNLHLDRNLARNPLFDILVVFRKKREGVSDDQSEDKMSLRPIESDTVSSKYDLSIYFDEGEDYLNTSIEFNTDLFSEDYVDRFYESFEYLIQNEIGQPTEEIKNISLTPNSLIEKKSKTFINNYSFNLGANEDLSQVAIKIENNAISYEKLWRQINGSISFFKRHIISEKEVTLCVKDDYLFITSLLGLLSFGITVNVKDQPDKLDQKNKTLIISDNYPKDLNHNTILAVQDIFEEDKRQWCVDDQSVFRVFNSDNSYEEVTMEQVNRYLSFLHDNCHFDFPVVSGVLANRSIDFLKEIFTVLSFGGTLVFNEEYTIGDWLNDSSISTLSINRSDWERLQNYHCSPSIMLLRYQGNCPPHIGIEKIKSENPYLRFSFEFAPLLPFQVIGLNQEVSNENLQVINSSKSQIDFYVSDMGECQTQVDVPGELIQIQYINSTAICNETGILCQINEQGELIYHGEKTDRVQIRGEILSRWTIENAINSIPEIIKCKIVLDDTAGGKRINVYYLSDKNCDSKIKNRLIDSHPSNILPDYYYYVSKFEYSNEQFDWQKTRRHIVTEKETNKEDPKLEKIKTQLKIIWDQVLDISDIRSDHDFFIIGGHSLHALQIHASIKQVFQIPVPNTTLFTYPTIDSLASYIYENSTKQIASSKRQFPINTLIQSVESSGDDQLNYALFVPEVKDGSSYGVLNILEPMARSRSAINMFSIISKMYRLILVSFNHIIEDASSESENFNTILDDLGKLYTLDLSKIYVTGFSKGAELAVQIGMEKPEIKAIIACGGSPTNISGAHHKPVIVSISGQRDYYYLNSFDFIDKMEHLGHSTKHIIGNHTHTWPSEEKLLEAYKWIHVQSLPPYHEDLESYCQQQFKLAKTIRSHNPRRAYQLLEGINNLKSSIEMDSKNILQELEGNIDVIMHAKSIKEQLTIEQTFHDMIENKMASDDLQLQQINTIIEIDSLLVWWKDFVNQRLTSKEDLDFRIVEFLKINTQLHLHEAKENEIGLNKEYYLNTILLLIDPNSVLANWIRCIHLALFGEKDLALSTLEITRKTDPALFEIVRAEYDNIEIRKQFDYLFE